MFQTVTIASAVAIFVAFWYIDKKGKPMHPLAATILAALCLLAACVFRIVKVGLGFTSLSDRAFFALSQSERGSSFLVLGYGIMAFALYKWCLAIWRKLRDA